MSKDNQLGDIALDRVNGLGFAAARLAPMHLLHLKRLRKRQGRWWADSDNGEYKPRLMRENDQTFGQVVWWAHTEE